MNIKTELTKEQIEMIKKGYAEAKGRAFATGSQQGIGQMEGIQFIMKVLGYSVKDLNDR